MLTSRSFWSNKTSFLSRQYDRSESLPICIGFQLFLTVSLYKYYCLNNPVLNLELVLANIWLDPSKMTDLMVMENDRLRQAVSGDCLIANKVCLNQRGFVCSLMKFTLLSGLLAYGFSGTSMPSRI